MNFKTPDLFDIDAARENRDAGMASVMENNDEFKTQFACTIDRLPRGWVGTCEDIRREWAGIVPHPNAWGACWGAAKKRGQLIELPQRVTMTAIKNHGCKRNLHRKV